MLSRFPNWVRSGLLLAMLAGTQTGCQTWKSPSFNMFPWSKKPSADKIVGTKPPTNLPTSSSSTSGPVSPALRNTPSPVPGSPTPNTNLASNPAGAIPSPGTAAANNGFTPGTYNVAQPRTNPASPNPYATAPNGANPNAVSPNAVSPYGANPYAATPAPSQPSGTVPSGLVSSASIPGTIPGANPYGSTLPPGASA
ncbi:MAG: hypothetical protein ACKO8U_09415, partial [Pirellula sp.]